MVCSKCQKKLKATELATPGVKRKSEMYYGSPSTTSGGGAGAGSATANKSKATLGNTGVSKNKLLSSKAKNPYAAYSSSCDMCKTKTEQGRKYCQRCAYQKNACPMCGKSLTGKSSKDQPVVTGQKFNLK
ncbi:cysteine-rich PDZ-binding protein [Aspergillus mulundensis]|uniref:Cysteine-rich PDZ-binding protein n=1 Tax=Aspergillus mulundensis TaxID=1810919 RepID=A0A3D8RYM6_9EURO|nr:Cysteine-rich PDZ-binding protein [Aspergillus mulundensis]RDW79163.1 Cysteine-rich PDZ-binding protein [Aspergillus mulundensis]